MLNLVTDRTQHNVDRLKKLQEIGWDNLSESQKTEYRGYAAKGAYNYTDMNRVENAVSVIAPLYGLELTVKTNWNYWTNWTSTVTGEMFAWEAELNRYLNNVKAIRDACPGDLEFPPLPDSMDCLTYKGANNIEKVLEIAYNYVATRSGVLGEGVLGKMVLGKEL